LDFKKFLPLLNSSPFFISSPIPSVFYSLSPLARERVRERGVFASPQPSPTTWRGSFCWGNFIPKHRQFIGRSLSQT